MGVKFLTLLSAAPHSSDTSSRHSLSKVEKPPGPRLETTSLNDDVAVVLSVLHLTTSLHADRTTVPHLCFLCSSYAGVFVVIVNETQFRSRQQSHLQLASHDLPVEVM